MSNTNPIHTDYVAILQGRHPSYRFGSDRIANANSFLRQNAAALVDFDTKELHPDVVLQVREDATKVK